MGNRLRLNRAAYARAYYRDTAERRRLLARNGRQCKRWAAWLLANLIWPIEPTPVVPVALPLRRPLLRLPK